MTTSRPLMRPTIGGDGARRCPCRRPPPPVRWCRGPAGAAAGSLPCAGRGGHCGVECRRRRFRGGRGRPFSRRWPATHGERSRGAGRCSGWASWGSRARRPPEHGGGGPARDRRADGGGGPGLSRCAAPKTRCWPGSVPSWTGARTGGPAGRPRSGRGWSNSSGSLTPRPGPTRRWPSTSSDLPHLGGRTVRGAPQPRQGALRCWRWPRPENEAEWAEAAGALSFKDLGALVRSKARPTRESDRADEEKRSVRFNDAAAHHGGPVAPALLRPGARRARGAGSRRWAQTARRPSTSAWPTPWSRSTPRRGAVGLGPGPPGGGPRALRGAGRPRVDAAR